MLQGKMTEYYPARDILSTNEISNIAYENKVKDAILECQYQINSCAISFKNMDVITKTHLFKCTENFSTKKWRFSDNSDIFHIFAQNIDCGYSLEPPRRGGSNEYPQSMFWAEIRKIIYTPVNPSFTI